MRHLLIAALLSLPSLASATEITWAGIDYGLVRMVGTGDFREPSEIFPGYLEKWNVLVLDEQVDDLSKRLRVDVVADVAHLTELHSATDPVMQIVRNDLVRTSDAYVTAEDVAERVRSYGLDRRGTALVFIADQLNKPQQSGCYWVTFFDVASGEVYSTDRRCGAARGFGFRNYWFGTVKAVIKTLRNSDVP